MIRQSTPATDIEGSQLALRFTAPTAEGGVLVAAIRLPGAALSRVTDDQGVPWTLANVTQQSASRLEVWFRRGSAQTFQASPLVPQGIWRTKHSPAGVTEIMGTVANGQVVQLAGLGIECAIGTKVPDAVQALHDLLLDVVAA